MGSSETPALQNVYIVKDPETRSSRAQAYILLRNGNRSVKNSDGTFMCPFCPKRKKQNYLHKDLLQHASGVGKSPSDKRSARQKGEHLALERFLEKDLPDEIIPTQDPSPSQIPTQNPSQEKEESDYDDKDEGDLENKFVWPWIGVVVNIPTRKGEAGRNVGESGSKLRDELAQRGFNPTRVRPLWNFHGHSGIALVEFDKGWHGFNNALSFERAYVADRHGKKEWVAEDEKNGLYAWLARADDYKSTGIVGEHLRKIGNLRTVSEIMADEAGKCDKLVSNLTNIVEEKNKNLKQIQLKFSETAKSIAKVVAENERLYGHYNQEIKKLQSSSRDHVQRIFHDFEKLKSQVDTQKHDLELRMAELEKREAVNDVESKKLAEEKEESAVRNSSMEMAALAQKHVDEKMLKLAEEQKRQKEKLHDEIIQLEKKLDAKQALELEIVSLRGNLKVFKEYEHMDGDNLEVLQKVEALQKGLREKEEEYEHIESLNQGLIVKEHNSNYELQEARKELVNGFKDMSDDAAIRVKRMGELDGLPFLEAMKRKYNEEEAENKAIELCSMWGEYLKDPDWHPLKIVEVEGKHKRIIDDEDERLKSLKKEMGEEVYESVVNAVMEINEYNASGGYITSELWNYEEGRRASLNEGVEVILRKWAQKKRRIESDERD